MNVIDKFCEEILLAFRDQLREALRITFQDEGLLALVIAVKRTKQLDRGDKEILVSRIIELFPAPDLETIVELRKILGSRLDLETRWVRIQLPQAKWPSDYYPSQREPDVRMYVSAANSENLGRYVWCPEHNRLEFCIWRGRKPGDVRTWLERIACGCKFEAYWSLTEKRFVHSQLH